MDRQQLQQKLSLQLLRASLRGKFEISATVESYNLTFMQAAVLCLLDPSDPLPMGALADFLKCTPSYITNTIEPLVAKSLIKRKELPSDRRVKALSLTDKGHILRSELLDIALDARLPNVSTLSVAELQATIQNLDKATPSSSPHSR